MTNRAPKLITIGVAVIFIVIGLLGTFLGVLPEKVGAWSYVIATVIMLLGVALRGL